MSKALIVYRSHSGVTRRYGEEIAGFLASRGVEAAVMSVGECDMAALAEVDYLLLGCWTSGMFVVAQRPDQPWMAFVSDMPKATRAGQRVGLFTTYKLVTGSQFPNMRAALSARTAEPTLELKSRTGHLSTADQLALKRFIAD